MSANNQTKIKGVDCLPQFEKGDDCLSQSDETETENAFGKLGLTEDELLSSSHENMETDLPLTLPNDPGLHPSVEPMDDEEDGITVTINLSGSQPSITGSNVTSGPIDGKTDQHPTDDANKQKPTGTKKITRSQRKQLKALRQSGLSRPEALSRITGGEAMVSTPSKRTRQDLDKSTNAEEEHKQKRMKQHLNPRKRVGQQETNSSTASTINKPPPEDKKQTSLSYGEITSRRRVGIIPKDFPTTQLSTTQLDVLQEALLLRVEQQRNATMKPKFSNLIYKSGHMVLICKDQETAEWVKEITPALNPLEGVELVAMDEDKIQRPELIRAFFPQSAQYTDDRIKALIESQNDLITNNWRVMQRLTPNNKHVVWVFNVDGPSMEKLIQSKFILNFRFGEIQLRKVKSTTPNSNDNPTGQPTQEKSEEASSSIPQPTPTIQASLSSSDGKDAYLTSLPGPSGVTSMAPNKGSGNVKSVKLTTADKPAGLGKGKDKNQNLRHPPKSKVDDPQHPKKDGKRPENAERLSND